MTAMEAVDQGTCKRCYGDLSRCSCRVKAEEMKSAHHFNLHALEKQTEMWKQKQMWIHVHVVRSQTVVL